MTALARAAAASLMAAALACSGAPVDTAAEEPITIDQIEGSDVATLRLSARAAERLAIGTAPVRAHRRGVQVPSGAVLVDEHGAWWVYTVPQDLTFVRRAVDLDRFDGARAFLRDGPAPGTRVVTYGAAELFGAEFGIGK